MSAVWNSANEAARRRRHLEKGNRMSATANTDRHKPRFQDIERLTRDGDYRVDVGWCNMKRWMEQLSETGGGGIDIDPDFQRGHVWDIKQQTAYVEFILKGGKGANELRFNCVDWMTGDMIEPVVIVDGLQRLTAARRFMNNEIAPFGYKLNEWVGRLDPIRYRFRILINNLKTRKQVLQWYLEINAAGTPHEATELQRVQKLLKRETMGSEPETAFESTNQRGGTNARATEHG